MQLGTISLPTLGLRFPLYQGTGESVLAKGPGHYPSTVLPGQRGTVAIAGHRVTPTPVSGDHGPFFEINRLRHGDPILLRLHGRRFFYRVMAMRIVVPTDVAVLRRHHGDWLVLTTCHPPHSAAHRLVVFARQVRARRLTGRHR